MTTKVFLIAVIVAMQFTLHAFVPKNENIGSIAIRVIKTLQLTIQACILDMYISDDCDCSILHALCCKFP